jgi:hypothetical protein
MMHQHGAQTHVLSCLASTRDLDRPAALGKEISR